MLDALIYSLFAILALLLILLIASFCIFLKIFYSPKRKFDEEYPIPDGDAYEAHREQMVKWIKEARGMAHRDVSITSSDGLTLCGKYYEYKSGAPIEILFHGYRGTAERDLSGGVCRCHSIGHSALIVDHRASGHSDGHVITFGKKESLDCLSWVDFVLREIDGDAKIILTGISMGAATVMIASSMKLPPNVVGVLADCGYSSTEKIIKKVIRDMKLPAKPIYPLVRLGALLFGGFKPDTPSPIEAMRRATLPTLFVHGDIDGFVPYTMSVENYEACTSEKKRLVIIKGADHGLCFPVGREDYLSELRSFFDPLTEVDA